MAYGASLSGLSGGRPPFGLRSIRPVGQEVAATAPLVPAPRMSVENSTSAGSPHAHELTDRDRELLRHLGSGLSTGRTAAAMALSTNTVRTRVRRLERKLEVSHRDAVVRFARESGLL